ncbi:MAG: amidohydrolase family protein [Cyclobacteriaceae bacterium]
MIDAHQHFWNYDPVKDAWITPEMGVLRRNFLPPDFKPVLDDFGIKGTVAVQADQSIEETFFLTDLAASCSFIKGVVGWVDLKAKNLESQLDQFAGIQVLKGFRHIIQAEPDFAFMLHKDFLKGAGLISGRGYTYDILIKPHQLDMAIRFSESLPDARLVVDHLAKPPIASGRWKEWAAGIEKFRQLDHVFCKVSGMVTEADPENLHSENFRVYLDVITDVFGTGRMMYGSDWPVCLLATDYAGTLRIATDYFSSFTESERLSIFSGNAIRFYNL